ncbi:MAG: glycosyltransferase family 2 protein [Syntrophobacter sp.]
MMKYTVVVPVFNGEDTIAECLASLLQQRDVTFGQDYHIVVIDDGSTDKTNQIVRQFPVEVIQLPKNEGRIIARLTGAKHARAQRLLFVDSRIVVSPDTLSKLEEFRDHPAVIGELKVEGTKYDTVFNTVLYLIRRKYYGKENFPMQADQLVISDKNFKRAPKGTALLLIVRDLFIELTPKRTGKEVNDDTLLFHNLVYQKRLNLLRSKKLLFQYSLRTDPRQFSNWLFHRGVRFTDFYLRPGGYFFVPFLLLLLFGLAGTMAAFLTEHGLCYLLTALLSLNTALTLYLSEEGRDYARVFFSLPVIASIFGLGIARFWAGKFRSAFSSAKNIG